MEEEEDEDLIMEATFTPLRFLFHRASFLLRQEDQEDIERQMVDSAIQQSMDTYHDSLFRVDGKLMAQLTPFVFKKPEHNDDDTQHNDMFKCYVCLGFLEDGEMATKLPCHHLFHSECIKDMVTHQHGVCPLCRSSIPVERLATPPPPNSIEVEDKPSL